MEGYCKYCESLIYCDGYYCGLEEVQDIENKEVLQIDDIENTRCEMFVKKKESFGLMESFNSQYK